MSLPNANNNNHASSLINSNNNNKSVIRKSSKSDLMRAAVGLLLKQKNYVGSEKIRKSDFLLQQNKNQFAVNKMLDTDLHGGNSFTYSNVQVITNNQHMVDQQFGRFSQFVEAQPEQLRVEMKRFYAPMLCHLYLELLKARESKGAVELLKKYAHLVAPVDLYDAPLPTKINGCSVTSESQLSTVSECHIRFASEAQNTGDTELDYFMKLVQILSGCTKLETAESDATVAHFRASKYELHTTAQVVDRIGAYLQRRGHVLILNLLYTWIHIHIVDNDQRLFTEDQLLGISEEMEPIEGYEADESITSHKSAVKNPKKRAAEEVIFKLETDIKTETDSSLAADKTKLNIDACLKTLKTSTEQILKSQVEMTCFYRISERSRGLTSADVDANECHMLAGFDNSSVQLWQLNQHRCKGKSLYRRAPHSQCNWEINNCQPEEQEELDSDEESFKCSTEQQRERQKALRNKYADNSFNEYGGLQLRGHTRGVTSVRFSAHYPLLYSVSKDCTMRCWRAHNLQCASIYRSHNYPIWCLDESPVGQYVVTGSKDLSARLWSLEREHALIIYAGHTQDVECVAFHPNGNYLATGSADHSVRLWCATSGKLMRVFADCRQAVTSLAFSGDGKMLAVAGDESKVRIFDLAAGAQLSELKDHPSSVTSLAWGAHNQQLATTCSDGSLRLWDIKKLTPMSESSNYSSSSSSSSSSATTNRLLTLNSSCQRLVNVFYGRSKTLYCIGT
ncbi:TAF5-like RNA polymerase II p300/CBP-associated factor-associated factor 65 kDa subunit 5L [Drosophila innubila]|uniref:TAF5-like RNA polymerase II p300/CBP-associated factor-associated factor 65 kDa subunit 5L n=1 Tax=Drosophila innubila TaxID=198719 RepID=UPI00148C3C63|nr:TAF5-like RNA polymerase II p300/CBP-associated factor-associated factor 65 kDa subunit 5L [Drosophila innubila]